MPELAGAVAPRPPTRDGGFGLHLVEALAHRWGVTREGFTSSGSNSPAGRRAELTLAPVRPGSGTAHVRAPR